MLDQAKQICITLLQSISNPKDSDISIAIDKALMLYPELAPQREELFKFLEAQFSIFSDDYKILVDPDSYKPWLKNKKADIKGDFWRRYSMYLQKKIDPSTLNKLDNLTDDILDRLIDPATPGPWDKRGMVVGQVQSGKTSNYTGLINKAADAGFKLIVILAGMHDSLRSQTQIRIDEGFLGFNTQTAMNFSNAGNRIGVGNYNKNLPAHSLTTSHLNGDFKKQVAQSSGVNISGSDPIVLVIKKNGSILKNLISWLAVRGDKMPDGKVVIRNLPFLLIDDEADNASINVDPKKISTINGCIRALLSIFEQRAYVGYTATPFANIFIPILTEEQMTGVDIAIKDYEFTVGEDLFPRDFIINIPAPSNYIGPAKVFGLPAASSSETAEEALPIIISIDDFQHIVDDSHPKAKSTFIPDKHKRSDPLPEEIPESLKYAIKCFVLSCAARRVRKQVDVHNSMLIHVSRFINWQDRIASLVDKELKFYQRQIEFDSGDLMKDLKSIWQKEFQPKTEQIIRDTHIYVDPEIRPISWKEVEGEIFKASSKIEVRAVHGDKNIAGLSYHNISPLDYFLSQEQGNFLSIIAVGGDKLSRGLTLEGLSISYYLRASKMYDTLMQMGRWFGYRPGYADLCRLFTSQDLIDWFKHITIASEEMRAEFEYMFLLNRTPRDFGLKVRTHKGVLKITAANKFRNKQIMQLSYSGELEQSYKFKTDKKAFESNWKKTVDFISLLDTPSGPVNSRVEGQKLVWKKNKNSSEVINYLNHFIIGREVMDMNKIADYINAQVKNGHLQNWTIALINKTSADKDNTFPFKIDGQNLSIGLTDRTNDTISNNHSTGSYSIIKAMIISPAHEMIDLENAQIENALRETEEDWKKMNRDKIPTIPSGFRIKVTRTPENGLLLIYPLHHSPYNKLPDGKFKREKISDYPIIGIAISFPEIEGDEKIEYAVNDQFVSEYDYPDELDAENNDDGQD
jgi:hypothetical protein